MLTPTHRIPQIEKATSDIAQAITKAARTYGLSDGELLRILADEIKSLNSKRPRHKRRLDEDMI